MVAGPRGAPMANAVPPVGIPHRLGLGNVTNQHVCMVGRTALVTVRRTGIVTNNNAQVSNSVPGYCCNKSCRCHFIEWYILHKDYGSTCNKCYLISVAFYICLFAPFSV